MNCIFHTSSTISWKMLGLVLPAAIIIFPISYIFGDVADRGVRLRAGATI
jgi:hypothetical protein